MYASFLEYARETRMDGRRNDVDNGTRITKELLE